MQHTQIGSGRGQQQPLIILSSQLQRCTGANRGYHAIPLPGEHIAHHLACTLSWPSHSSQFTGPGDQRRQHDLVEACTLSLLPGLDTLYPYQTIRHSTCSSSLNFWARPLLSSILGTAALPSSTSLSCSGQGNSDPAGEGRSTRPSTS